LKFKSNNYYEIEEIEMKKKNDELKLRIERKVEAVATPEKFESLGKILERILSTKFSNTLLFKPRKSTTLFPI
jgi:hypothetical protein